MRKLRVSTLVTLDGVIQDPGGFGETAQGGWGSPYFTEEAAQEAYAQLMNSDYFLCGRITYELLSKKWGNVDSGPYMSRMKAIPKLVASRTLKEPLTWNARLIEGDAVAEIEKLKQESGKDILMYGSASLGRALMRLGLVDEFVSGPSARAGGGQASVRRRPRERRASPDQHPDTQARRGHSDVCTRRMKTEPTRNARRHGAIAVHDRHGKSQSAGSSLGVHSGRHC